VTRPAASSTRETETGPLEIAVAAAAPVWRIGYGPDPFAWTPWQHAEAGRFEGRWDDPAGTYRTIYLGQSLLAVLLEVLARFRPDLELASELAGIDDPDGEAERYPTLPAGQLPRSWLRPRLAGTAGLHGEFVDVRAAATIATLRRRFAALAADLGLPDLDAAALKTSAPRRLTQTISGWLYTLAPPLSGVSFASRHGDTHILWAVFEQPGEADTGSSCLHRPTAVTLSPDMPELIEAMRIQHLAWSN
jgi:hypothetical protein